MAVSWAHVDYEAQKTYYLLKAFAQVGDRESIETIFSVFIQLAAINADANKEARLQQLINTAYETLYAICQHAGIHIKRNNYVFKRPPTNSLSIE